MGQSETRAYLYDACRKAEPKHSHSDAALHPLNNWFLEKVGKPEGRARVVFCLLQFCENPFIDPLHSGDGSGDHSTRLDDAGFAGCVITRSRVYAIINTPLGAGRLLNINYLKRAVRQPGRRRLMSVRSSV